MLDWLHETLTYDLPWWLWIAPATAGGVGVFLLVTRFLGFRNGVSAAAIFAAISIIGIAASRGRQIGWKDRIRKENRDAQNQIDRAKDARDRVRKLGPDRLYDDDGYKRQ